jgi:hypothetical protein
VTSRVWTVSDLETELPGKSASESSRCAVQWLGLRPIILATRREEHARRVTVHRRSSTGLQSNRGRATQGAVGLPAFVLLGLLGLIGGSPAAATVHPAKAQGSAVVQQYLTALGVAGSKLSKVEATLRALGPSATRAQVLVAASPFGPALAPIEALLTAPPPTTLEALDPPESQIGGTGYRTTEEGAHLDVGGRLYPNGFQVDLGEGSARLTWPTHASVASRN